MNPPHENFLRTPLISTVNFFVFRDGTRLVANIPTSDYIEMQLNRLIRTAQHLRIYCATTVCIQRCNGVRNSTCTEISCSVQHESHAVPFVTNEYRVISDTFKTQTAFIGNI